MSSFKCYNASSPLDKAYGNTKSPEEHLMVHWRVPWLFASVGPLPHFVGGVLPTTWAYSICPQHKITSEGDPTEIRDLCHPGKTPLAFHTLSLFFPFPHKGTKTVFDALDYSRDCNNIMDESRTNRPFPQSGLLLQFNKQNWDGKVVQSALLNH